MDGGSNRERAEKAFRDWHDGTGSITDLLADDLQWTIVGRSQGSSRVLRATGSRLSG